MKHSDLRELASGAALILVGLFSALFAHDNYQMGSVLRMGPGFVPFWVGLVVAGIGMLVAVLSLLTEAADHDLPVPFHPRPLVAIITAVLFFGLTVKSIGLLPTAMISTFIASFAERAFSPKRTAILAVALAALIWVVFIVLLKISLPAFNIPGN